MNENLLKNLFDINDNDVKKFTEVIKDSLSGEEPISIQSDIAYTVSSQKWLEITHGNHGNNYVWHISPLSEKRPWKASQDKIVYAIGLVFSQIFPKDILFDIFLPQKNLGIQMFTIKGKDVLSHWAVSEKELTKTTLTLFEALNVFL